MVLYSTGCPQCAVLKKKLLEKGIEFTEVNDIDIMLAKGITAVPTLEALEVQYNFKEALDYVKNINIEG